MAARGETEGSRAPLQDLEIFRCFQTPQRSLAPSPCYGSSSITRLRAGLRSIVHSLALR